MHAQPLNLAQIMLTNSKLQCQLASSLAVRACAQPRRHRSMIRTPCVGYRFVYGPRSPNVQAGGRSPFRGLCRWGWLLVIALLAGCAGRAPRRLTVGAEDYRPLSRVARAYGLTLTVEHHQHARLTGTPWLIELQADSRRARVNGVVVWLHQPVIQHRRHLAMAVVDVETVLDPLLRPARHLTAVERPRVLIDPGHGGSDPGARGATGITEKELVLRLGRKVANRLAAVGIEVALTRDADDTLSLAERVELTATADLLVSLHLNAAANPAAQGIETYLLPAAGQPGTADPGGNDQPAATAGNAFDGANQVLGYLLQQALLHATGGEDRGLRRARFFLLRTAPCPAVLVEAGFLSHAAEEQRWLDPIYREQVANGIVTGIRAYLALTEKGGR